MRAADDETSAIAQWAVQLRKGALGLAVMATLWSEKLYGLEIIRRLQLDAALTVPEGTIYPLLNRLKSEGLVSSEWVEAEAGHPSKYYALTPKGRDAVTWMTRVWWGFSLGLNQLLAPLEKDLAMDRRLPGWATRQDPSDDADEETGQ
jgi:PadR family transcriptional regulator, regulatory protein PadR